MAAIAYKQLVGREIDTVILLGPSHYARFKGAYLPDVDAYQTPLGLAVFAPLAGRLRNTGPFAAKPECQVERPGWWREAKKEVPPFGQDTPDTWEHSLEVQLPLLQTVAPKARIVPITYGEVNPEEVANAIAPHLDGKTIIIASSDLSHYKPYDTAKHLDKSCTDTIVDLNIERMQFEEACGQAPILTVMHLAKAKNWRPKLLDYRNSGDTTGDRSRGVVGYAAIAFSQSASPLTRPVAATNPATAPRRITRALSDRSCSRWRA